MRRDAGVSLIELLTAVALISVVAGVAMAYSVRWMAEENLRATANDFRAQLRLAQMESVSRNRPCRLVVNVESRVIVVLDSVGTATPDDDELLHQVQLPQSIAFDRPDSGLVVGLQSLGDNRFQVVFDSEGIVIAGDGQIHLQGASGFGRISVFVAGGTEIAYWTGVEWAEGA